MVDSFVNSFGKRDRMMLAIGYVIRPQILSILLLGMSPLRVLEIILTVLRRKTSGTVHDGLNW